MGDMNCELVNTYDILEHVLGINGLHPHSKRVMTDIRRKLVDHVAARFAEDSGVILDVGCGSGAGARELSGLAKGRRRVVGIDINGRAVEQARRSATPGENIEFFHGTIEEYLERHPDTRVHGALCSSVTMFMPDVAAFYRMMHGALAEGGMLVDAPFVFRDGGGEIEEELKAATYSVCGCSMKMYRTTELRRALERAGFARVTCVEHGFDLMEPRVLLADYPPGMLALNFARNVTRPKEPLQAAPALYLLKRTLQIFTFFFRRRCRYGGGELSACKGSA